MEKGLKQLLIVGVSTGILATYLNLKDVQTIDVSSESEAIFSNVNERLFSFELNPVIKEEELSRLQKIKTEFFSVPFPKYQNNLETTALSGIKPPFHRKMLPFNHYS